MDDRFFTTDGETDGRADSKVVINLAKFENKKTK